MTLAHLYATLAAERRCPVCGAAAMELEPVQFRATARFECGSAFAASETLGTIIASDACPRGSEIQADLLTMKAVSGEAPDPADVILLSVAASDEGVSAFTSAIFRKAEAARLKAQMRYPQPTYTALKVAEEAGEVVRGAVHYAEKRLSWEELEGEVVQTIAMCLRLLVEGDQVNGVIPPHVQKAGAA